MIRPTRRPQLQRLVPLLAAQSSAENQRPLQALQTAQLQLTVATAISDDESDLDGTVVPVPTKQTKKATVVPNDNDLNDSVDEDDDMPDAIKGDVDNGDEEGEEELEDAEDLDEDEFVVEKILTHVVQEDVSRNT